MKLRRTRWAPIHNRKSELAEKPINPKGGLIKFYPVFKVNIKTGKILLDRRKERWHMLKEREVFKDETPNKS